MQVLDRRSMRIGRWGTCMHENEWFVSVNIRIETLAEYAKQ